MFHSFTGLNDGQRFHEIRNSLKTQSPFMLQGIVSGQSKIEIYDRLLLFSTSNFDAQLELIDGSIFDYKANALNAQKDLLQNIKDHTNSALIIKRINWGKSAARQFKELYFEACLKLNYPGCHYYYDKPDAKLKAPFTPVQEMALRWARFLLLYPRSTNFKVNTTINLKYNSKAITVEKLAALSEIETSEWVNVIEDSHAILSMFFSTAETAKIDDGIIRPARNSLVMEYSKR